MRPRRTVFSAPLGGRLAPAYIPAPGDRPPTRRSRSRDCPLTANHPMLHHARFSLFAILAAALPAQSPCFELNLGTDLQLSDDSTAQGLQLGFTFNFSTVGYTAV